MAEPQKQEQGITRLESLRPEQRRYMERMLGEALAYMKYAVAEPTAIGPVIWEAMLALERKSDRPAA